MKRGSLPADLHLELLKKYEVSLGSNGEVVDSNKVELPAKEVIFGYRDEGPDAWANSERFEGPAWLWTSYEGWELYKNGVTITGYAGLSATLVTIEKDELHVIKCIGVES